MNEQFIYHVLINGGIFFILTAGAKFFLKLKNVVDFSYIGIVIFGAYAASLLNSIRGRDMLSSMGGAFILALVFTFLILYLSDRLQGLYFTIGTLALYILFLQLAQNLESITNGMFGLSGMSRNLLGIANLKSLESFLIFILIVCVLIIAGLIYLDRSYLRKVLQGRGEKDIVIKSLGVQANKYKLVMITITTALAVIGGSLFSFYIQFIEPTSFWLNMLVLLLMLIFGSYKFGRVGTFIFCLLVVGGREYLRFFKVVDPSQIGYFRTIVFALLVMVTSVRVFRTTQFGRDQ